MNENDMELELKANDLSDMQNMLVCRLMDASDANAKHTESLQERVEKLKDVVQKIMPEKMETYFHISEDMSTDPFNRFNDEDVLNSLYNCMKYDLIQCIAEI